MVKASAREHQAIVRRLAKLHDVATSYTDASGVKKSPSTEALARIVTALGSPCATEAQAAVSERDRIAAQEAVLLEPVIVSWQGRRTEVELVIAGAKSKGSTKLPWSITLEDGQTIEGTAEGSAISTKSLRGPDGRLRSVATFSLPARLPQGYHTLNIEHAGATLRATVISAPVKSFRHGGDVYGREWGVFCPTYALRSDRNLGCGDFTDLREIARWTDSFGGRVAATLPLLAGFLGEKPGHFDPSPYAPVSRLFWNELFIDPERAPEFERCEDARKLMASASFRKEAASLRASRFVDYRRCASLKRTVLEKLAETFSSGNGEKSESFRAFLAETPQAREYAAFRAVTEKQGKAWSEWPSKLQRGNFTAADSDPAVVRYHLYAQYLAWLELLALGSDLKAHGGLLYLDLPVGVSPHGFDVFRNQGLFVAGCSTGAPPDPYFTGGQNWGFPSMHPEACRRESYAYFIASLRNHMRHADYLRLDHVMAFHRLFFIPDGMTAADGTYVHYRHEEMYAILCLESHRNRCRLVGENLGTVPPEVNKALTMHDLCGLYVGQYEMQPNAPGLRAVPSNCIASVNTHDMPPFATCWAGGDINDRIDQNMLDSSKHASEERMRQRMKKALIALLRKKKLLVGGKTDAASVRDALVAYLAEGSADFVLMNIEDLWLETNWQNIPGTMDSHPNWQRKLKFTIDEIKADPKLAAQLIAMDRSRKGRTTLASAGAKKSSRRPVRALA